MTDANLVAWFPMTKGSSTTLYDYSGNANNGTLVNTPTWEKEKTGQYSLDFNGTTQYGSFDAINFNDKDFSVFAWIKFNTTGAAATFISTLTSSYANYTGFEFLVSLTNTIGVNFYGDNLLSTTVLDEDTWYCVTMSFDAVTKKRILYIDGVEDTNDTTSDVYKGTIDSLGVYYSGKIHYYNGKLSNVRIYDRVLSLNEVKDLYKKTYIE